MKKTNEQKINDLEHDTEHLYFLIGALTDCIANLPNDCRENFIAAIQEKANKTKSESREILITMIEAIKE